uniref:hypothetical protein n=1 Tax=Desulfurococcus amylolyticus TaxID=94694 RepID=UPI003C6C6CFF
GRIEYAGRSTAIGVNSIEAVDPLAKSRRLLVDVEEKDGFKIVFASLTRLRGPLRRSRFKSMVSTSFNVFSTPTFLYLVSKCLLQSREVPLPTYSNTQELQRDDSILEDSMG